MSKGKLSAEEFVRDTLEQLRAAYGDNLAASFKRHGLPCVYKGKEDLLLRHGQFHVPQPLPKGYRRMRRGVCFGNAWQLAVRSRPGYRSGELRYAEGVAVSAECPVFPIHHAWCLDANDRVIDPTWPTPALAYFGVTFSITRVLEAHSPNNQSVLDDFEHDYPVLLKPYTHGLNASA